MRFKAEMGTYSSVVGQSVHLIAPEGHFAGQVALLCQDDRLRDRETQAELLGTICDALNATDADEARAPVQCDICKGWAVGLATGRCKCATHAAEPAPVAWRYHDGVENRWRLSEDNTWFLRQKNNIGGDLQPLYTHPPHADLAPTGNTALVERVAELEADLQFMTENRNKWQDAATRARRERDALQPDAPQPTPEVEALREALKSAVDGWADCLDEGDPVPDWVRPARAALARGSVAEKGELT